MGKLYPGIGQLPALRRSTPITLPEDLQALYYEYNPAYIKSAESNDRASWTNEAISIQLGDLGGGYDDIAFGYPVFCDTDYDFSGLTFGSSQVIVSPGDEGTYDTNYALFCSVIYDSDDSKYKMIYVGDDSSDKRFIYCDSVDGINFSNHTMVLEKGNYAGDTAQITSPSIIKTGGKFYILYSSTPTVSDGWGLRLSFAESDDCLTWSNFSEGIKGATGGQQCGSPSLITAQSGYKGLYAARGTTLGSGTQNYIYIAGADGNNWTTLTRMSFTTTNAYTPWAIVDTGTKFYLYYGNFVGASVQVVEATKP